MGVLAAIGWIAGWYFNAGYTPLIIAILVALFLSLISYFSGDKIALSLAGARKIEKADNPYVYNMVENLTITAGLPLPKVYLITDPALNAFATGRDPQHSSIALTTGIVEALENEELEGVIAHELSHVKNYDIRVMMIVIICVSAITLLANIMTRNALWGGGRRSGNERDTIGPLIMIIGLIFVILSPLIAQLMQLAISRKREYLADASGALLTRYPEGLARALEKISQSEPLKHSNKAIAHLYINEPEGSAAKNRPSRWLQLFSTHPPITDRIARLRSVTN
ncbi:MAG: M48 family metallopeptidase [Candidatus Komeilibacteria bacterium]